MNISILAIRMPRETAIFRWLSRKCAAVALGICAWMACASASRGEATIDLNNFSPDRPFYLLEPGAYASGSDVYVEVWGGPVGGPMQPVPNAYGVTRFNLVFDGYFDGMVGLMTNLTGYSTGQFQVRIWKGASTFESAPLKALSSVFTQATGNYIRTSPPVPAQGVPLLIPESLVLRHIVSPSIVTPPQSRTAVVGNTVTFSVTASGTAPLLYQWFWNSSLLAGQTNASLALSPVQSSQAGNYLVRVSNAGGSVDSAPASLTVWTPVAIVAQPASQNTLASSNVTFSVVASGSTPLAYQWYFNGSAMSGKTNSSLTLLNVQKAQSGQYYAVVSNPAGFTNSAVAQLAVNSRPTLSLISKTNILELAAWSVQTMASDPDLPAQTLTYSLTAAPAGATINSTNGLIRWTPSEAQGPSTNTFTVRVADNGSPAASATASFTVVVAEVNQAPTLDPIADQQGDEGALLQWTAAGSDADLPAQTLTYSLESAPPTATIDPATGQIQWTPGEAQGPSTNTFTVRVTDNGSPAATASTSFTVIVFEDDEPPSIITQPASLAVNEGDPATFSVAAAGSEPFVYQWRINGTNIPGANEASLVLAETVLSDAGNYTVFISNEVGDATSEIAVLTINPAALLSGRGLDGYIAGGTVFFDANLNGKLDEGEPSTTTDPAGRFDLKVVVARFDANQNGGLDLEEGQLVLQGGVDISTGLPLEMPLSAPPGANVITPLTALLNELARRDESLPLAEAETQLEEALGLPPEVQLLEFDPLAAAVANDTAAAPVLQAAAKVQDTVVQIAALLDQSTPDASPADLAREVIAQIASAVQTNPTVNLSDTQLVGTVIQETASAMQATVDPAVQQGAAQVIAAINQAKDQLVAEAEGALAAAAAISQVQWIAQGQAAEQLKQAGSGTLVIDEVVAAQTCHALNQAIAQAPVGNLTGTEQPPGIVAFSHDSFSVLENGVAVQEVTITRHQGNEGAVRLQIALSDGTARLADGDYGATSIDVVLSDHELSRTVSLAGIIQDDDLAEGAETLSLTLSFSPDDSSGASLGTITAATLQIVDNDAVGTFAFTEAEHAIFEDSICCKAITITRSGGASGEVELLVTPLPVDGGATPNVDYHAQPISVLFSDGNQLRLITVPILSDGKFEPDEPMDLQLDLADGAPAGAAIGSIRTARVVILNDDPEPPRVGFARTDGAQFDFTVHGQAGYHCRIEGSEDLVNWVAVQDLELNAAIQSVPLPIPPNTGQRFYRAVVWK